MSDAELDQLIEQARPSLRQAISAILQQKSFAMMFPIGLIPFPNKQAWEVTCIIMIEPMAKLVAPLIVHGIPNMFDSQMKPGLKEGATPSQPPPQQPRKSGGLSALMP